MSLHEVWRQLSAGFSQKMEKEAGAAQNNKRPDNEED
jgi:hypothetical protein